MLEQKAYGKAKIDELLTPLLAKVDEFTTGEIDYIITRVLLAKYPRVHTDYHIAIGVLECVKTLFYRYCHRPYNYF